MQTNIAASNYRLNRWGYYADFVTVPFATTIAVLWMLSLHTFRADVFASAVLAGAGAWTLFEYVVHRWVFHGSHSPEHKFHHLLPDEYIGASPITTTLIGALTFWFLTVTFGPLVGVGLQVGLAIGYLFYLYVHDRMHHSMIRAGTYLAALNRNHDYHHRRFRVNYGATSPFWDHVFGTYQKSPAKPTNEV